MAKQRSKRRRPADAADASSDGAQDGAVYAPKAAAKIKQWAEEAASANELVLYDVEVEIHGRWAIRVFIDRPGALDVQNGVTAGECQKVSRYLEAYLDAATEVPVSYLLEVSSPGIERALKTVAHLNQVVGHRVQLIVREPVAGKNKVCGELVSYQQETLSVLLDEDPGEPVDIPWADVKEARLKYDFEF